MAFHPIDGGGQYVDFGIEMRGGLLAGVELARVCLSDLAEVAIVAGEVGGRPIPLVQVVTDHPVQACLASQYAGWGSRTASSSRWVRGRCGPPPVTRRSTM